MDLSVAPGAVPLLEVPLLTLSPASLKLLCCWWWGPPWVRSAWSSGAVRARSAPSVDCPWWLWVDILVPQALSCTETPSELLAAGSSWPGGSGSPRPRPIARGTKINNSCPHVVPWQHPSVSRPLGWEALLYVLNLSLELHKGSEEVSPFGAFRRGMSHLYATSLSTSISKVPPVCVLQSLWHSHPLPGEIVLVSSRGRGPEWFDLFIWVQRAACSCLGLTGFEAQACGPCDLCIAEYNTPVTTPNTQRSFCASALLGHHSPWDWVGRLDS